MSKENVEIVRLALETFQAAPKTGGYESMLDGLADWPLDPEIEWDPREVAESFGVPDIGQVYVGIEGGRTFWREWLSAWDAVTYDYELIDAGDHVVVILDQQMKGRITGIDVRLGEFAQVFTFRDGLLVRWKCYAKQEDAFEAVGLSK
jgi:hypothetical protein